MQRHSDLDERTVCPNSVDPRMWYPCKDLKTCTDPETALFAKSALQVLRLEWTLTLTLTPTLHLTLADTPTPTPTPNPHPTRNPNPSPSPSPNPNQVLRLECREVSDFYMAGGCRKGETLYLKDQGGGQGYLSWGGGLSVPSLALAHYI